MTCVAQGHKKVNCEPSGLVSARDASMDVGINLDFAWGLQVVL